MDYLLIFPTCKLSISRPFSCAWVVWEEYGQLDKHTCWAWIPPLVFRGRVSDQIWSSVIRIPFDCIRNGIAVSNSDD